jgi:hypothetical protein
MYLSIHYHSRLPRRVMLCTYVRTDPLYQLFIARDKETVPLALIRRKNFQVKFVSLKIVVTDLLLLPQSPSLTQFLTFVRLVELPPFDSTPPSFNFNLDRWISSSLRHTTTRNHFLYLHTYPSEIPTHTRLTTLLALNFAITASTLFTDDNSPFVPNASITDSGWLPLLRCTTFDARVTEVANFYSECIIQLPKCVLSFHYTPSSCNLSLVQKPFFVRRDHFLGVFLVQLCCF